MLLAVDASALAVLFAQATTVTLRRVNHGAEHGSLGKPSKHAQPITHGANGVAVSTTIPPSKNTYNKECNYHNTQ